MMKSQALHYNVRYMLNYVKCPS